MTSHPILIVVLAFSILSGFASATAAEPKNTEDRVQESVDKGLAYLSNLKNLKELDLVGTRITGAGLKHLAGLTKLEMLKISENSCSQTAIAELQRSAQRCHVTTPSFRD